MVASQIIDQRALIRSNVELLRQALDLMSQIGDAEFRDAPPQMEPHKAGSHLRHVLEFYECFIRGVSRGTIDYDSRQRDASVETSREVAMARIAAIVQCLESDALLQMDTLVLVRAEDAESLGLADPFVTSSIARELLTLSSHTIHHFALIAMTLRAHGVAVDPDFGVAPSTLRHRRKLAVA